jgi:osmotically inducible protein OsmC
VSATSKVIYVARTETFGGRENGFSRSSDGLLDIRFSVPGSVGIGTNPEQLFAAAWSASFASALALAAMKRKVALPAEMTIKAEVGLVAESEGYSLTGRLRVALPGIERTVGQALLEDARQVCPVSSAVRRDLDMTFELVDAHLRPII